MFERFKNTNFEKILSTIAALCFLLVIQVSYLTSIVSYKNLISYINAGNLTKPKIHIFI